MNRCDDCGRDLGLRAFSTRLGALGRVQLCAPCSGRLCSELVAHMRKIRKDLGAAQHLGQESKEGRS